MPDLISRYRKKQGGKSLVERLSQEEGLSPQQTQVVLAMMQQESGGSLGAVSGAGARGPLQVMPATGHRFVKPEEFATPEGQTRAGIRYYKYLDEMFGGKPEYAVTAYHAGEGKVKKYYKAGQPIPKAPEFYDKYAGIYSSDHTARVLANLKKIRGEYQTGETEGDLIAQARSGKAPTTDSEGGDLIAKYRSQGNKNVQTAVESSGASQRVGFARSGMVANAPNPLTPSERVGFARSQKIPRRITASAPQYSPAEARFPRIAAVSSSVGRALGEIPAGILDLSALIDSYVERRPITDTGSHQTANWIRNKIKEISPAPNEYSDSFLYNDLPSGATSIAGMLAGGAAGGARGVVGMGMAQGVGEMVSDAESHGANPDQIRQAGLLGAPIGLVDAYFPEGIFERMAGGQARKHIVRSLISSALKEGGTEFAQQVGQNLAAAYGIGYDPNRKWDEGAWRAAAAGGILGSATDVVAQQFEGQPHRPQGVEEILSDKGAIVNPLAASPGTAQVRVGNLTGERGIDPERGDFVKFDNGEIVYLEEPKQAPSDRLPVSIPIQATGDALSVLAERAAKRIEIGLSATSTTHPDVINNDGSLSRNLFNPKIAVPVETREGKVLLATPYPLNEQEKLDLIIEASPGRISDPESYFRVIYEDGSRDNFVHKSRIKADFTPSADASIEIEAAPGLIPTKNPAKVKWDSHAWDYAQIAAHGIWSGSESWYDDLTSRFPELELIDRSEIERRARRLLKGGLALSKARDGNGQLVKGFHGTPEAYHQYNEAYDSGFNTYGAGFNVADDPGPAAGAYSEGFDLTKKNSRPNVRPVYLDLSNPLDLRDSKGAEKLLIAAREAIKNPETIAKLTKLHQKVDSWWNEDDTIEELKAAQKAARQAQKSGKGIEDLLFPERLADLEPLYMRSLAEGLGFDGLAHTGGEILDSINEKGGKYNVWIAFHPEQIVPAAYAHSENGQSLKEVLVHDRDEPVEHEAGSAMTRLFEPVLKGEVALGGFHPIDFDDIYVGAKGLLPVLDEYVRQYAESKGVPLEVVAFEDPLPHGNQLNIYVVNYSKAAEVLKQHGISEAPQSFISRAHETVFREGTPEKQAITKLYSEELKRQPPVVREAEHRIRKGVSADEELDLPTAGIEEVGWELYNPLISYPAWRRAMVKEFDGTPDLSRKLAELWQQLRSSTQPVEDDPLELPEEPPKEDGPTTEQVQNAFPEVGLEHIEMPNGHRVLGKMADKDMGRQGWDKWQDNLKIRLEIADSPALQKLSGHLEHLTDVVRNFIADEYERQASERAEEYSQESGLSDMDEDALFEALEDELYTYAETKKEGKRLADRYRQAKWGGWILDPKVNGINYPAQWSQKLGEEVGNLYLNPFLMARMFYKHAYTYNIPPAHHSGVMASSILSTLVHEITHEEVRSSSLRKGELPSKSQHHLHGPEFEEAFVRNVDMTMRLCEELGWQLEQALDKETLKEIGKYARALYNPFFGNDRNSPDSVYQRYAPLIEGQARAAARAAGDFEAIPPPRRQAPATHTGNGWVYASAAGNSEPPPGKPGRGDRRFVVKAEWVDDTYADGEQIRDRAGAIAKRLEFKVIDSETGKVRGQFKGFGEAQKGADSLEKSARVKGEPVGPSAPKDEVSLNREREDYDLLVRIYKAKVEKRPAQMIMLVKEARAKGIDGKRISEATAGKSPWYTEPQAAPASQKKILTLFHGTDASFDNFRLNHDIGIHLGSVEAANAVATNRNRGPESGANVRKVRVTLGKVAKIPDVGDFSGPLGLIDELFKIGALNADEYSRVEQESEYGEGGWEEAINKLRAILVAKGYDALEYQNDAEGGSSISYAVLRPELIKNAIGEKELNPPPTLHQKGKPVEIQAEVKYNATPSMTEDTSAPFPTSDEPMIRKGPWPSQKTDDPFGPELEENDEPIPTWEQYTLSGNRKPNENLKQWRVELAKLKKQAAKMREVRKGNLTAEPKDNFGHVLNEIDRLEKFIAEEEDFRSIQDVSDGPSFDENDEPAPAPPKTFNARHDTITESMKGKPPTGHTDQRPRRPDLTQQELSHDIHRTFYKMAGDLLERKGVKRDKSITMMEQVRQTVMNSDAADLIDINRFLESHDIDLSSFMLGLSMPTSSQAGQYLNTLSQIAKQIGDVAQREPSFAKELERIRKAQLTRLEDMNASLYARWTGIFKGAMVGAWATATRNAASQAGRLGIDAMVDGLDGALQVARGKADREGGVHPLDGLEIFLHLGREAAISAKSGAAYVKGKLGMRAEAPISVADQLLSALPGLSDRLYQTFLSDVEDVERKLRPRRTRAERLTAKVEDAVRLINFLNVGQEYTVRRAVFTAKMFQEARNRKIDLHDIIERNDREAMQNLPKEMWEAAIHKALDASFAAEPENEIAIRALSTMRSIQKHPAGMGFLFDFPFPRFLIQALKFHYQYSPISIPELLFSEKEKAKIAAGDHKRIARATMGTAMLLIGIAMAASRKDDERWYEYYGFDTRPFNPFAGYLFLGDAIHRKIAGKDFDYTPQEFLNSMLAMGSRADTSLTILGRITGYFTEEDGKAPIQHTAEYAGDIVGRFFQPATTVKDIYASTFDEAVKYITGHGGEEKTLRDTASEMPLLAPTLNKFPGLSQMLPEAQTPTKSAPPKAVRPWAKQLLGLRFMEEKTPLESEIQRDNFKFREVFTSTGDVDFDRDMMKQMGEIADSPEVKKLLTSKEFKSRSEDERSYILSELLSKMREAGRKVASAKNPDKYLKFRFDDMPKRKRQLLLNQMPERPPGL